MDQNIVEQVTRIEEEADKVVADAKRRAQELEQSAEREIQDLRKAHERELQDKLSALKEKLQAQTAARLAEIEENARKAEARLDALDAWAVNRATELIVKHLREA